MKVYFLILIAFLFLTGCSTSTNPADENSGANPGVSDPQGSPANTEDVSEKLNALPKDAIRAFVESVKAKDEAGVKAAVSEKTFKMLLLEARLSGKEGASMFESEAFKDVGELPEIRNEKIDGEKASLEVREKGDSEWTAMPLIKVSGSWKLAYADEAYDKNYEEMLKKAGDKSEKPKEGEPNSENGEVKKKTASEN